MSTMRDGSNWKRPHMEPKSFHLEEAILLLDKEHELFTLAQLLSLHDMGDWRKTAQKPQIISVGGLTVAYRSRTFRTH